MDTPLPRTLKIGRIDIGLIGLDQALAKALRDELSEEQAVNMLFTEVARQNYIPTAAVQVYRDALRREYRRHRQQGDIPGKDISIRVLGPPCVSCNKMKNLVIELLQKMDLAADVDDIHDLDEIWRYGITKTPALVINGEVKCAGRQPAPFQLEEWLREAAAGQ